MGRDRRDRWRVTGGRSVICGGVPGGRGPCVCARTHVCVPGGRDLRARGRRSDGSCSRLGAVDCRLPWQAERRTLQPTRRIRRNTYYGSTHFGSTYYGSTSHCSAYYGSNLSWPYLRARRLAMSRLTMLAIRTAALVNEEYLGAALPPRNAQLPGICRVVARVARIAHISCIARIACIARALCVCSRRTYCLCRKY